MWMAARTWFVDIGRGWLMAFIVAWSAGCWQYSRWKCRLVLARLLDKAWGHLLGLVIWGGCVVTSDSGSVLPG